MLDIIDFISTLTIILNTTFFFIAFGKSDGLRFVCKKYLYTVWVYYFFVAIFEGAMLYSWFDKHTFLPVTRVILMALAVLSIIGTAAIYNRAK